MIQSNLTNEFGIVLNVASDFARDVLIIRRQLAASPYRDDPPHVTLLNGIKSPQFMTDEELISVVEAQLRDFWATSPKFEADGITHMWSPYYDSSAVVELRLPPNVNDFRQIFIRQLLTSGFQIEASKKDAYRPHVTLRLGVELEAAILNEAERLFPRGRIVNLKDWSIYRLKADSTKRLMHEVKKNY